MLTTVFYNLVPVNFSCLTFWQPILTITSTPYWSHTQPSMLLTILHQSKPFFTLAHNISSMQSIHSSRFSSDVPSSVEPSPTLSGPDRCFPLWAPTRTCPHLIREQDLFPQMIPAVTLEQGICHVHRRTASVFVMCTSQICNKFNYSG